jgi:hypothetical protein
VEGGGGEKGKKNLRSSSVADIYSSGKLSASDYWRDQNTQMNQILFMFNPFYTFKYSFSFERWDDLERADMEKAVVYF